MGLVVIPGPPGALLRRPEGGTRFLLEVLLEDLGLLKYDVTVRKYIKKHRIPVVRQGQTVFIAKAELYRVLDGLGWIRYK